MHAVIRLVLDFLKVVRLVFWSGVVGFRSLALRARSLALRARTIALRAHSRATRSKARLVSKSSSRRNARNMCVIFYTHINLENSLLSLTEYGKNTELSLE